MNRLALSRTDVLACVVILIVLVVAVTYVGSQLLSLSADQRVAHEVHALDQASFTVRKALTHQYAWSEQGLQTLHGIYTNGAGGIYLNSDLIFPGVQLSTMSDENVDFIVLRMDGHADRKIIMGVSP